MLRKAIGATFILLLMTQVISAQQDSGSAPLRPGLHYKGDNPSRSKEQRAYDNFIDHEYQTKFKDIPNAGKKDPWGNIRQRPPKTNNSECLTLAASRHPGLSRGCDPFATLG